jgi:hypothetical protein
MSGPMARLMRIDDEFKQFAGTVYQVDSYFHPEHACICVSFSRKDPKLGNFSETYEIRDDGYDAKAIARILKSSIKKKMDDAKARGE